MCVLTEGQRASQQTCNPTQVKVTEPEPQDEPDLSLRGDIRATGSPLSSSNLRNPGPPGPSSGVFTFSWWQPGPSLTACLGVRSWELLSSSGLTPSSVTHTVFLGGGEALSGRVHGLGCPPYKYTLSPTCVPNES